MAKRPWLNWKRKRRDRLNSRSCGSELNPQSSREFSYQSPRSALKKRPQQPLQKKPLQLPARSRSLGRGLPLKLNQSRRFWRTSYPSWSNLWVADSPRSPKPRNQNLQQLWNLNPRRKLFRLKASVLELWTNLYLTWRPRWAAISTFPASQFRRRFLMLLRQLLMLRPVNPLFLSP